MIDESKKRHNKRENQMFLVLIVALALAGAWVLLGFQGGFYHDCDAYYIGRQCPPTK